MPSETLAATHPRDKPAPPPAARPPWRARAAAVVLVALAAAALVRELQRAVASARAGPLLPADAHARFEELATHLPRRGPTVEVVPGLDVAFIGYLSDPDAFKPYREAVRDPQLRRVAQLAAFRYGIAQQALAPRVLALPGSPFFEAARYVLGDFGSAEAVPAAASLGMEHLWDDGEGLVLWRRP